MASWHHRPLHQLAFVLTHGVTGGPVWLILCLVVGFVQWVSVGYEVGHGGFGSQWIGVGCGVFLGGFVGWVVVAHGGGATHGLPWVALKCLSQASRVTGVSAVGGAPDLGFRGFGGGSQWVGDLIWVLGVSAVGDPIWVLGVSAVGGGGWGTRSGFWGLRRRGGVGIRLGLMG
uniref:Uncharacterized protein n=1 Tax=Fagus sylvatica TaxID=28930 RepID=A0A2N9I6F0_FAGSY